MRRQLFPLLDAHAQTHAGSSYLVQIPTTLPALEVDSAMIADDDDEIALVGRSARVPDVCTPLAEHPEGLVGRLRIYRSGRREMVFGKQVMSLDVGGQCDHLSQVCLVPGEICCCRKRPRPVFVPWPFPFFPHTDLIHQTHTHTNSYTQLILTHTHRTLTPNTHAHAQLNALLRWCRGTMTRGKPPTPIRTSQSWCSPQLWRACSATRRRPSTKTMPCEQAGVWGMYTRHRGILK